MYPLYVRPVDTGPSGKDASPIEFRVVYAFIHLKLGN